MGKNLSAYLNALGPLVRKSVIHEPEQVIRGVANDSRRVGKDFIFCAIKGAKSDGHCFISDAVRNGASVIFASDEVSVPEWISVIYVSDSYHAWGVLCAEFFDNPADHLFYMQNNRQILANLLVRKVFLDYLNPINRAYRK